MHEDLAKVEQGVHALLAECPPLSLSTMDPQGFPVATMTPGLRVPQGFVILVSGLAAHTAPLINDGRVGVLLAAAQAPQAYARVRMSLRCRASVVPRDSASYVTYLEQMQDQFGGIISVLDGLPDFVMLLLKPIEARYVSGFGAAWVLDPNSFKPLSQVRG